MTIEIRELVIQARVTSPEHTTAPLVATLPQLGHPERARLVAEITRAVLEKLRSERGESLMGLLDVGLAKLTITAFSDREMKSKVGEIKAMYNPASIQLSYHTDFTEDSFINRDADISKYQKARPGGLNLELLFDARLPGNNVSLDSQLANLRALCCDVDSKNNAPRFLQVRWGKMSWNGNGYFAGRMANLVLGYTLFDRDATPLRAKATLSLRADKSLEAQSLSFDSSKADMSIVTVPDVSPLALIAAASAVDYLALAVTNGLDNLDDTQPGGTLVVNRGGAS